MKENNDQWVCIGRIIRPHGVKGALSLKLENPQSQSLRPGLKIRVETKRGIAQEHIVTSFVAGRILSLSGLDDRNIAEAFNQSTVFIKRSDFPALRNDEIYLNDMLGFEVLDQENNSIGHVEAFSDNTAQVLIEVRLSDGRVGMIPFVAALVKKVDEGAKTIIVDLPEGLLENENSSV